MCVVFFNLPVLLGGTPFPMKRARVCVSQVLTLMTHLLVLFYPCREGERWRREVLRELADLPRDGCQGVRYARTSV